MNNTLYFSIIAINRNLWLEGEHVLGDFMKSFGSQMPLEEFDPSFSTEDETILQSLIEDISNYDIYDFR